MTRAEIAKLLRSGVQSDIWYDFDLSDDEDDSRETLIINVQYAMNLAAEILEVKDAAA